MEGSKGLITTVTISFKPPGKHNVLRAYRARSFTLPQESLNCGIRFKYKSTFTSKEIIPLVSHCPHPKP